MSLKKVTIYLSFLFIFISCVSLAMADELKSQKISPAIDKDTTSNMKKKSNLLSNVDSLFVIHFHPTVQCSCCINVGNFAKKGLEKYYAKPYKEGRIVFRERNSEEDSLTVRKYHLLESALAFQKFSGENNEFKEIESVWEFCEDERKFLPTFKKELDEFMGRSKEEKPQTKAQDEKARQGEEQMMGKAKEILKTKKIYAVVGVSQDRSKYGYEVFHSLQQAGYKTYPINPKYDEIAGCKCYPSLENLPENPEVVILTLAPSNSEKMIENFSKHQIQMLWLPPGCWSDVAVEKCRQMSIPFICDVCPVGTLQAMKGE
jgi:hypothetical protein